MSRPRMIPVILLQSNLRPSNVFLEIILPSIHVTLFLTLHSWCVAKLCKIFLNPGKVLKVVTKLSHERKNANTVSDVSCIPRKVKKYSENRKRKFTFIFELVLFVLTLYSLTHSHYVFHPFFFAIWRLGRSVRLSACPKWGNGNVLTFWLFFRWFL